MARGNRRRFGRDPLEIILGELGYLERMVHKLSNDFTSFEALVKDMAAGIDSVQTEIDALVAQIGSAGSAGMTADETAQLVVDLTALRDRLVAVAAEHPAV